MPFFQWVTRSNVVNANFWEQAVKAHDEWINRLNQLPVELILASRPAIEKNRYLNKEFLTNNIDINDAKNAKVTCTRYVKE